MSNNSEENKKARKAYKKWYNSLPEADRAKAPPPERIDDCSGMDGNWVFEAREQMVELVYPLASMDGSIHKDTEDDDEEVKKPPQERLYTREELEEVIRRVVMAMQMTEHPEVLFHARCILIAFGIGDPPTETELAKAKGCSRQFVSKKVKRIQQEFALSPSQFMRSQQACAAYAAAYRRRSKDREGR